MQANYTFCLKEILRHEGGYVNHPRDPGGETNKGITKATAVANGYTGSMRSIPDSVVEAIYRKKFWNAAGCYTGDTLASGVDLAVFDFGVNSGPSRAAKYLMLSVGGDAVDTIKKLCAKRMGFLRALKTFSTFGKGWTRRVADVEAKSVKLALQGAGVAPAQVEKKLKDEAQAAQKQRDTEVAKGSVPTAGEAGHLPANLPADPSFDWSTLLYVGVGLAVAVAIAYFAVKAYQNHQRARAYAEAAKDTK